MRAQALHYIVVGALLVIQTLTTIAQTPPNVVIAKWHLGLGAGNINWNSDVKHGPHEIGFAYNFHFASHERSLISILLSKRRQKG